MFYTFNQNNSGGDFDFDKVAGITHYVIIEADSADEANAKALEIGLYFDGAHDCPCCGNRWSEVWGGYGVSEVPSIYEEPIETYLAGDSMRWMEPGAEIVVHYADGRMVWH